jgi:hypothetical protein
MGNIAAQNNHWDPVVDTLDLVKLAQPATLLDFSDK